MGKIKDLKDETVVQNLAWEVYQFGCRNPRDVDHPDTAEVFASWYEMIFKNAEDLGL